jgi:hypothetical protein
MELGEVCNRCCTFQWLPLAIAFGAKPSSSAPATSWPRLAIYFNSQLRYFLFIISCSSISSAPPHLTTVAPPLTPPFGRSGRQARPVRRARFGHGVHASVTACTLRSLRARFGHGAHASVTACTLRSRRARFGHGAHASVTARTLRSRRARFGHCAHACHSAHASVTAHVSIDVRAARHGRHCGHSRRPRRRD